MSSAADVMWGNLGKQQHAYFLKLREERAEWMRRTKEALWYKWDGHCALCPKELGVSYITIDHICPKRHGGTDELHNLRPLCKACHGDLNRHEQCLGSLLLSRGLARTAPIPLITAATLADTAWRVGELDRHLGAEDITDLIAEACDGAEDELGATIPLSVVEQARALLLARHDGELVAQERDAAALLADEIEAGDRDRLGRYVPYERYP